jgi:tryptophan synthase alpha chain
MNSKISKYIIDKNKNGEKVLSVYLTSGFPKPNNFTDLALKTLDAGADMLEIGFPFSDPIADGPVIQHSTQTALNNGIDLNKTLKYVKEIKANTDKPLILMGYANPLLSYGIEKFSTDSKSYTVDGLIVPDMTLDEYDDFFTSDFDGTDIILLITPTTPTERIKLIDKKSSGFVYCVSLTGTTGIRKKAKEKNLEFVKGAYEFKPFCDGVIVGSAVIKSLMNDNNKYQNTLDLVRNLKSGLKN